MATTLATSKAVKHPLLIVDDEPEVLASLRSMFRREYKVLTARRADEALQLLRTEPVHVVVTDQRMPGMSGADFLAKVREEFPDAIRLMITGYSDIESVIDAINRGHVYRYISKPWDPVELESIVRQAVEQFELVAERRRLLRELQEANQLKTAFITIASHELNTPLTIVLGMLELALSKSKESVVTGFLERSLKAAKRLQGLLASTFKLLQQREFKKQLDLMPFCCLDLLRDIRDDLEPYLRERRQTLSVAANPEDLQVFASKPHLRDALVNLVNNAIKFSPDGSTIEMLADEHEGNTRIRVTDRGIGISYQDQPHIFEPLFSTWDTMRHSTGDFGFCKRGMGLGLAIARKFVEMHGGEITFQSEPTKGAVFQILLPIRHESEDQPVPTP